MKRLRKLLLLILATTLLCHPADARTFVITRLTTPTITAGSRKLKVGDKIDEKAHIQWADDRQAMEVRDVATGRLYRFTQKALRSKWDASSIADFFVTTSKGSSRGKRGTVLFHKANDVSQFPEKRMALVIGNSNYNNLSYLRNAQNDASDIANTLQSLGFDVYETYECDYTEMREALMTMTKAAANYDIALFYYAGHGIQDDGVNYLVPVDAALQLRSELRECLNADDVLAAMEQSGAAERLIFLDACRDTKKSWSRSAENGLAKMEGSTGTAIMFSTMSGKVAFDGEGSNSPFANSLMAAIQSPGLSFPEAMSTVTRNTYQATNGRQTPLQVGLILSDFRFNPSKASVVSAPRAKANPRPVPSRPAAAPAPAPTAVQPSIALHSDFDVTVQSCIRTGNDVVIRLLLTNRSSDEFTAYAYEGNGNQAKAYDNRGNTYDLTYHVAEGNYYSGTGRRPLPVGIGVQLDVKVKNVGRNVSEFKRVDVPFRGCLASDIYARDILKIKDLKIGYTAPTRTSQDNHATTIHSPIPGLKIGAYAGLRQGSDIIVTLTFQNDTENVISALFCDGTFIGPDGRSSSKIYNVDSANQRVNLPSEIPAKLILKLLGFGHSGNNIPYIRIRLRGVNPYQSYGEAVVEIRNLPIK